MKNLCFLCLTAALALSVPSSSQTAVPSVQTPPWNAVLEQILDYCGADAGTLEELQLTLEDLHDNPININAATPAQLERLPFLTDEQIEEISAYIYYHGPLASLGEMQLIYGIDVETAGMLRQFTFAGTQVESSRNPSLKQVLAYGRQELIAGFDIPLYLRSGFKPHTYDELVRYPNRQYLGDPLTHSLRWSLNWNGRIRVGLTAQQDGGEPFMGRIYTSKILTDSGNSAATFDFLSPYLYIQDMGPFQALALGRFKVQYGCGLLLGSSFTTAVEQVSAPKAAGGIRPWTGATESGYFTGAGVQTGGRYHSFSLFASSQKVDAALDAQGLISSLKTDGYHRTQLEMSRRHNVRESAAGASVQYRREGTEFGVTAFGDLFSKPFAGDSLTESRQQSWSGGLFAGISANYALKRPGFAFWGETAQSVHGFGLENGLASQANVQLHLGNRRELSFMARYYSPDYLSMHCSAASQSGVSNEFGLTCAWDKQKGKFKTRLVADAFRHPKPVFGASAASNGLQLRCDWQYTNYKIGKILANMNLKTVQKDCKATDGLEYKTTVRSKVRYCTQVGERWSVQGVFQLSVCSFKGNGLKWGRAAGFTVSRRTADNTETAVLEQSSVPGVSPSAAGTPVSRVSNGFFSSSRFDLDFSGCLFAADGSDSSISYYEPGPRYQYGFMTLTGRGARMAAMAKIRMPYGLQAAVKASGTFYFDRNEIGDGARTIDSNHKEDIALQLAWKFQPAGRWWKK